jgi:hypothetical protein
MLAVVVLVQWRRRKRGLWGAAGAVVVLLGLGLLFTGWYAWPGATAKRFISLVPPPAVPVTLSEFAGMPGNCHVPRRAVTRRPTPSPAKVGDAFLTGDPFQGRFPVYFFFP